MQSHVRNLGFYFSTNGDKIYGIWKPFNVQDFVRKSHGKKLHDEHPSYIF